MQARKAGKVARRFTLSIGLLCSKTFDDAIFPELFEAKYGLARADIVKMNIKGVFQVWMKDGSYHEVPLKEAHAWTREGCTSCPDFAAEHADISTGGIGAFGDWTLTLAAHREGRGALQRHGGGRRDRDPAHRGRPRSGHPHEQAEPDQPQALARHGRAHARAAARARPHCLSCAVSGPRTDAFAAHLGIEVERRGPGPHGGHAHHGRAARQPARHRARRRLLCGGGAAVAAAANDAENSGIISSVLVEYLQPAALGDELYAEVAREVSTGREDIFTGSVRRGEQGDLLAWVRRAAPAEPARLNLTGAGLESPLAAGTHESGRWPNLWEPCH